MTTSSFALTSELAGKFARLALSHLTREYPNKLDHVMNDAREVRSPRELHPVFFGSFDWHSCVHGYWLLATIHRLFPSCREAKDIEQLFKTQLTSENVDAELRYLQQPLRNTFERPYGWAWLLMLAAELSRGGPRREQWGNSLRPLADAFVDRFKNFLPKATYPTRVGTHFNSAFAIVLAHEYATEVQDEELAHLLSATATRWFRNDADAQAWEPGGDDFLSPSLMEAECMRRVIRPADFSTWLERFLPQVSVREPSTLFKPAIVSDRSDGKIAHLDGLNLSRAWCWRSLAQTWPETDKRRAIAAEATETHLAASMPYVAGDYMGEHWLATFALLALL